MPGLPGRKSVFASRWSKAGLVLGLLTLWIVLFLAGTVEPSKVKVYVRNVGCEARGFRIGQWSYESGPDIVIENDGSWICLGEHETDEIGLQMFGVDGHAMLSRGLHTGRYPDWGSRNVVTITMLEGGMVVTMRRGPPKPVSSSAPEP